ncbi:RNase adapter RapZ [Altererythrobacter salegens]|uniref:RNase adapter RapZ n=1 Tax=Croceibacterium salegens TaxID=1737568 RepID=A0A6I4T0N3_9SPHN|nr:RNase adapter RapZ [Croceibacterium salegens]MXO60202.1 RNase adapter RapZ [Croceibacterium salegens]
MADTAPSEDRQRILLVTGMLGAGKTTVLRELENLGWEALDNFPIRLLRRLIGKEGERHEQEAPPLAIGFDGRTRGFKPDEIIARVKQLSARPDLVISTLFLDCTTVELERRFDETRRRHHMAQDSPLTEGIAAERELLAPLRHWADVLIDTTRYSTNELKQVVRDRFGAESPGSLTVTVASFGFARGVPPAADLVFDMRFLDNPHWVPELREQTGLDPAVGQHIERDPSFAPAFERIADLVTFLLPRYDAQGKTYVTVAIGCTGGRHRSVYTAEKLAGVLRGAGFTPTVLHRNLGSRAAEMIEGVQQS